MVLDKGSSRHLIGYWFSTIYWRDVDRRPAFFRKVGQVLTKLSHTSASRIFSFILSLIYTEREASVSECTSCPSTHFSPGIVQLQRRSQSRNCISPRPNTNNRSSPMRSPRHLFSTPSTNTPLPITMHKRHSSCLNFHRIPSISSINSCSFNSFSFNSSSIDSSSVNCVLLNTYVCQLPLPTLAPRTIMHDLVSKYITVDAEKPATSLAFISSRLGYAIFVPCRRSSLRLILRTFCGPRITTVLTLRRPEGHTLVVLSRVTRASMPQMSVRPLRESGEASKTVFLLRCPCLCPAHFPPILQRKEVVIAPC